MKIRGAGSIATCLSQFIDKNLTWSVHTLKTLKDSCGGQNRNSSDIPVAVHSFQVLW